MITLTDSSGQTRRINPDYIMEYSRLARQQHTRVLLLGQVAVDVRESPDEIDALIEKF